MRNPLNRNALFLLPLLFVARGRRGRVALDERRRAPDGRPRASSRRSPRRTCRRWTGKLRTSPSSPAGASGARRPSSSPFEGRRATSSAASPAARTPTTRLTRRSPPAGPGSPRVDPGSSMTRRRLATPSSFRSSSPASTRRPATARPPTSATQYRPSRLLRHAGAEESRRGLRQATRRREDLRQARRHSRRAADEVLRGRGLPPGLRRPPPRRQLRPQRLQAQDRARPQAVRRPC